MKIKKNGKVINLTEGDLKKIVKKVLNEQDQESDGVETKGTAMKVLKSFGKVIGDEEKLSNSPRYTLKNDFIELKNTLISFLDDSAKLASGKENEWCNGFFRSGIGRLKSSIEKFIGNIINLEVEPKNILGGNNFFSGFKHLFKTCIDYKNSPGKGNMVTIYNQQNFREFLKALHDFKNTLNAMEKPKYANELKESISHVIENSKGILKIKSS
jgi:hypothetical protein